MTCTLKIDRATAALMIETQLENGGEYCHKYGRTHLRDLLDAIYGPPQSEAEKICGHEDVLAGDAKEKRKTYAQLVSDTVAANAERRNREAELFRLQNGLRSTIKDDPMMKNSVYRRLAAGKLYG